MRKTIPIFILLVSLVLAACSSATSEPTFDPTAIEESIDATLTALATGEEPPPTEEQPTEEPPTATPSPSPSPSPSPTPSPTPAPVDTDPAEILGEPDGVDTFDAKGNWTLFDTNCFKSEITDGVYQMTAKGEQGIMCWEVSWPDMDNFYSDTIVFMPEDCQVNDRFGLVFRAPDTDRSYQYGLTCDGRYSLTLWDGERTTVLIEATPSDLINVGLDAVNRMGVSAYGGSYALYVNGIFLEEAFDSTFTGPGKIGYFIQASSTNSYITQYDNLRIWLLEDQLIHPSAPPPPSTGELPPPDTGVPTVITTTYVNVRSGPDTFYPVLVVVPPGTSGEAVGISADQQWYAVEVPTSLIQSGVGWVSKDFVATSGTENLPVVPAPPPPPGIEPSPPSEGDPQVTTTDAVNIRNGPNNQCPSYGVPPIGSTAPAYGISADNGWYAIGIPTEFAEDGIGWVNAVYVDAINVENLPVMESDLCP